MTVYLHDWAESGEAGMLSDFSITEEALTGATVLIASYTYEDYSGSAFVLFERGGELFEVNGSHCSCYGLGSDDYSGSDTTQWQPEKTTVEALRHRVEAGTFGEEDRIREPLLAVLDRLAPKAAGGKVY